MRDDQLISPVITVVFCIVWFVFGVAIAHWDDAPPDTRQAILPYQDQNDYCYLNIFLANEHGADLHGITCFHNNEVWVEKGLTCHANPKERAAMYC